MKSICLPDTALCSKLSPRRALCKAPPAPQPYRAECDYLACHWDAGWALRSTSWTHTLREQASQRNSVWPIAVMVNHLMHGVHKVSGQPREHSGSHKYLSITDWSVQSIYLCCRFLPRGWEQRMGWLQEDEQNLPVLVLHVCMYHLLVSPPPDPLDLSWFSLCERKKGKRLFVWPQVWKGCNLLIEKKDLSSRRTEMKSCKLEPLARIPCGGRLCIRGRSDAVGTAISDLSDTICFNESKSWIKENVRAEQILPRQSLSIT